LGFFTLLTINIGGVLSEDLSYLFVAFLAEVVIPRSCQIHLDLDVYRLQGDLPWYCSIATIPQHFDLEVRVIPSHTPAHMNLLLISYHRYKNQGVGWAVAPQNSDFSTCQVLQRER